jgi:hypothetical protein
LALPRQINAHPVTLANWIFPMISYDDLVELARICIKQAREAAHPTVAAELRLVARGYQMRAASMKHGKLPDIGETLSDDPEKL